MKKHAYLIMAHDNFDMLNVLLRELDHQKNDIFIHIDKKIINLDVQAISKGVNQSTITFINQMNVTWGAYSQIQCEINLLKESLVGEYSYYHLLSGLDLPIKSQSYIHDFFDRNDGVEFLQFQQENIKSRNLERVKYHYPFQEVVGKKKNFLWFLGKMYKYLQKMIGVDRTRKYGLEFQMGANWFSITNELAKYLVKREQDIQRIFKNTLNGDELFIQTLVYNSSFKDNISQPNYNNSCHSNLRYVVWENDTPKYFKEADFDRLQSSDELFARKFSMKESGQLIEKILLNNH